MAKFKEGDMIKDTNPRCTHYGAIGKVVKIGEGRTTFIVTNDGDTFKKGDKLSKTNNQLEKQAWVTAAVTAATLAIPLIAKGVKGIAKGVKRFTRPPGAAMHRAKAQQLQRLGAPNMRLSAGIRNARAANLPKMAEEKPKVDPKYLNIKALPDGKPMVVHTPMDSLMYKVLSDTTKIKQNQAILDSIRSGKLDPKEYNARVAKNRLKKEGEAKMFKFNGQNKVASPHLDDVSIYDAESSQQHMYPESARMGKIQGVLPGIAGGAALGAVATDKIKNKKLKGLAMILSGLGGGAVGASIGQRLFGGPTGKEQLEMAQLVEDAKSSQKTAGVEKDAFIGAATPRVMSLKKLDKAQKALQGTTKPVGEKSISLAQQILEAKKKGDKLTVQKLQQQFTKQAEMDKIKAFVSMGDSVEDAAKKAYPNASANEIQEYVSSYKSSKKGGKKSKMYVDKVVLKKANLIRKAAEKLNFGKIANASLGYRGVLPGSTAPTTASVAGSVPGVGAYTGGNKLPNQVGTVSPTGGGTH